MKEMCLPILKGGKANLSFWNIHISDRMPFLKSSNCSAFKMFYTIQIGDISMTVSIDK